MRTRAEGPWSPEALAEDQHRLAEFERTRMGVPWEEVEAWMQSWGKPAELPRPKQIIKFIGSEAASIGLARLDFPHHMRRVGQCSA
jgi:hypothetical protein